MRTEIVLCTLLLACAPIPTAAQESTDQPLDALETPGVERELPFLKANFSGIRCPLASCTLSGYGFGDDWSCCTICGDLPKRHTGLDLRAAAGDSVFAAAAGTVKLVYPAGTGWAQGMLLTHTDANNQAFVTQYLHVVPVVSSGSVTRGQKIATIADISSPHLHFGVWNAGYTSASEIQRGALPDSTAVSSSTGRCCSGANNTYCDLPFPQSFITPYPARPTSVRASNGTCTGYVRITWAAATGAASYKIERATSSSGTKTVIASGLTGTGYSDSTALAGRTYYYWVTGVNAIGSGLRSSYNSGYRAASLSQGSCAAPYLLPAEGGVFAGTTVGAGREQASCSGMLAPEAVYIWKPAVSGIWTVSTDGSAFDTLLYVRVASCSGAELSCADSKNSASSGERLQLDVTAGETYYIVVDGWSSEAGRYQLSITRN